MIKRLFITPVVSCLLFPLLIGVIFIQEHHVPYGRIIPFWTNNDWLLLPFMVVMVNVIPFIFYCLLYFRNPDKALNLFIKISSGILILLFSFMFFGIIGTSELLEYLFNDHSLNDITLTTAGKVYYGLVLPIILLSIRKLYHMLISVYSLRVDGRV